MEQQPLSVVRHNNEDDDEFYENIEAPKFVDFTVPDLSRPDDRFWFCLRVGCDQNHEEDLDPDTLYRNFVLRVMAARSPNLKLQKALNRQAPRANAKRPLSAPAKSYKSRISRLAAITSVSQRMADTKLKIHPIYKLNSTPNVKAKQSSIATKALTTPRHKKCLPKPDSFHSVQNPKKSVAVPKSRLVAKALVFQTPKKTERTGTSFQSPTPMSEICSGMKNLALSSQRKHASPHSCVIPSRYRTYNPKKALPPSDQSKARSARKVISRDKVSSVYRDYKGQQANSSRLKSQTKGNLQNNHEPLPPEQVDNDSSDMEIDGKSRDGSLEVFSLSGGSGSQESNVREGNLTSTENSGNSRSAATCSIPEELGGTSEKSPIMKNLPLVLTNAQSCEASSISTSEKDLKQKDPPLSPTLKAKGESGHEEVIIRCKPQDGMDSEDLSIHQTSNGAGDKEAVESDDKENDLSSDNNRKLNINSDHSERKILGRHNEACQNHHKVTQVTGKKSNGCSVSVTAGTQGVKYKKTKLTNPKPFRLRTDERGILKEANLERRLNFLPPLKGITTVPSVTIVSAQRRHGQGDELQNEKSQKQRKHENFALEGNKNQTDRNVQKIQLQGMKPAYHNTSNLSAETKMASIVPKLEDGREVTAQNPKSRTKQAMSPSVQQQRIRTQRVASLMKKTTSLASTNQLNITKETSKIVSQPKAAAESIETSTTSAKAGAVGSSTRGRRHATIPKEPNFHNIHIPKSCTKKLAKATP
uniref:Uncharacterized protein n=1 Tax=Nelumbo nucifera TaxID=4432 RepID=A0A822ZYP0_NELNU|nr:TPA_asm: hypothetical protein HUJ06_018176 [Nelumbo nucifera]